MNVVSLNQPGCGGIEKNPWHILVMMVMMAKDVLAVLFFEL
jgi:hypothetical protein